MEAFPTYRLQTATSVTRDLTSFAFVKAVFASMLAAFWAYEGWNTIGFLGGEIRNPNRNIPRALMGGMALIIITYLLVNFVYFYILPIDKMVEVYRSQNEIAGVAVIRQFAGNTGAFALSLLILITTFGCTNSTIIMPPRIYQAMARDGLFFKGIADIHPRFNTPDKALWLQGAWASLLVLSGSFDQLTNMLIFVVFFFMAQRHSVFLSCGSGNLCLKGLTKPGVIRWYLPYLSCSV